MARKAISVRIDDNNRRALDRIAAGRKSDRSEVVNEAIEAYIEVHRWQIERIGQGLREADAGEFASEAEVKKALKRWRK